MTDKAQDVVPPPEAEEMQAVFSVPAVFANKVYLTLAGPHARLAFAELIPPDQKPVFRSAVMMSIDDLYALQEAILSLRNNMESAEVKQEQDNV